MEIKKMKARALIVLSVLAMLVLACNKGVKGPNGVVYKTAQQYNDYIINRQTDVLKQILAFGEVAQYNIDSAEGLLNKSISDIENAIDDIKGMPAYKGNTELRDAAVSSFGFYKKIFSNEYKQILDIKRKTALAESDVNEIQSLVDKIADEEKGYDERFHNAQLKFARDNNMKMKENEMQKEIDKVND